MKLSRIVGAMLPGRRRLPEESEPSGPGRTGVEGGRDLGRPADAAVAGRSPSPALEEPAAESLLSLLPPELRESSPEPAEPPAAHEAETPDRVLSVAQPVVPPPGPAPAVVAPSLPDPPDDLLALLPPELRQGGEPASGAPDPTPAPVPAAPARPAVAAPTPAPGPDLDLGALLAAEFRSPTRHRPEAERAGRAAPAAPSPVPAVRLAPASGPDIAAAADMQGFLAACLVDAETGLLLASEGGGGLDLEAAAAVSSGVLRAELAVVEHLGLEDRVEEILATTGDQLHLLRPLDRTTGVFLFVALDRRAANLGMARRQIARLEAGLEL